MRRFVVVAFLVALMAGGYSAIGQGDGGNAKPSPSVDTPTDPDIQQQMRTLRSEIDRRKKDLLYQQSVLNVADPKNQARFAALKKEIQTLEQELVSLLRDAEDKRKAEAKKLSTDEKLALILKKLDSLEKRMSDMEKRSLGKDRGKR